MDSKYLINLRTIIQDAEASLTVRGEDPTQVINDAIQLLTLARTAPTPTTSHQVLREQTDHPTNHTPPDHACPIHGLAKQGKWGLFCPTKLEDGTYCKWTLAPTRSTN